MENKNLERRRKAWYREWVRIGRQVEKELGVDERAWRRLFTNDIPITQRWYIPNIIKSHRLFERAKFLRECINECERKGLKNLQEPTKRYTEPKID